MMVEKMAKKTKHNNLDSLVTLARTDATALGMLYENYYDRIFRFCMHRLFYREIAEDVTANVFLAVAKNINSFKGTTEKDFTSWLYVIAANNANQHIRKTKRQNSILERNAHLIAAGNDEKTDNNWPEIHKAIIRLKPLHQTIITLRYFENLTHDQIANIVGKSSAAVRTALHRGLKELRKHLNTVSGESIVL